MCCCVSVGRTGIKSVLRDRIEAKAVAHGAEGVQRTVRVISHGHVSLVSFPNIGIAPHLYAATLHLPTVRPLSEHQGSS